MEKKLDLITIGRSSVDLYGEQVGGRLEDMGSFKKYIGGSPTNIAAGASRLGLKSALITRVGNEHMGRFIREELIREGVDVSAVKTDPTRLTALVLLGIRDKETFPLIFYRENCADMGLVEEDIDPDFIACAKCVCATGTHLSNQQTTAAVLKALRLAREAGKRTVLDIDYRPNLWGLAGHNEGESRYMSSEEVTQTLLSTVGLFDLIVGTEEEFHIAGGTTNTIDALRVVRKHTQALLICKRGPMGAAAFPENIPDNLDDGVTGAGFRVEVFNVLGAGDGFMAGLLYGWLKGFELSQALQFANACGAFAVSRHGCTPSYPSLEELQYFIKYGSKQFALRKDKWLEHIHWATNRRTTRSTINLVSLEQQFWEAGSQQDNKAKRREFRKLIVQAVQSLHQQTPKFGLIFAPDEWRDLVNFASGSDLYICRVPTLTNQASEKPNHHSPADLFSFSEWPLEHSVKAHIHLGKNQDNKVNISLLKDQFEFSRKSRLEFVIELIHDKSITDIDSSIKEAIELCYSHGILPDLWIVDPIDSSISKELASVIGHHDTYCRGFLFNYGLRNDAKQFLKGDQKLIGTVIPNELFTSIATEWVKGRQDSYQSIEMIQNKILSVCI